MKKSSQVKQPKTTPPVLRDSGSGEFAVVKPAVTPQWLKPRAIAEAVRKVNLAQQVASKK